MLRTRHSLLMLLTAAAIGLSGCGQSTADFTKELDTKIAQKDFAAAEFMLKSRLQQASESGAQSETLIYREKLARLHRETHNWKAEEKELEAIYNAVTSDPKLLSAMKMTLPQIERRLARAYVRNESVSIDDLPDDASGEITMLKWISGREDSRKNRPEIKGQYAVFNAVLESLEQLPVDQSFKMNVGDSPVPAITDWDQDDQNAWDTYKHLLGFELYMSQGARENAWKELREYLKIEPYDIAKHVQSVQLALSLGRSAEAEDELVFLESKLKDQPLIIEMRAIQLFQKGLYQESLSMAEKASIADPNLVVSRIIAAYSAVQVKDLERAKKELELIVDKLPPTHAARRLYLQLSVADGNISPDAIAQQAMSLDGLSAEDISMLGRIGLSMNAMGKTEQAKAIAEKVAAAASGKNIDGDQAVSLGLLQMSLGSSDALTTLEQAFEQSGFSAITTNALANAYISMSKWDGALSVASRIESESPAQASIIRAVVALKKDPSPASWKDAEVQFEKALEQEPKLMAAHMGIIESKMATGDMDGAVSKMDQLINEDYALAAVRQFLAFAISYKMDESKRNQLIEKWLSTDRFKMNPEANLLRINAFILNKQWQSAMSILESSPVKSEMIKAPGYWLMKIVTRNAIDPTKTDQDYLDWLAAIPSDKTALMSVANIKVSQKDFSGAIEVLNAHKKEHKDSSAIDMMVMNVQLMQQDYKAARETFALLPKSIIDSDVGKGLEAILWVTEGRLLEAAPRLDVLYRAAPTEQYAIWRYFAYEGQSKLKEAEDALKEHLEKEPKSSITRTYLANLYAAKGEYKQSVIEFKTALNDGGENALLLNNMAFVEGQLGLFDDAVAHAEKALQLAQGNETVIDTLAGIYVQKKEFSKAVALLKPLAGKMTLDSTVATYIKALSESGDSDTAASVWSSHEWKSPEEKGKAKVK